ncbi:hypothetical protein [Terrabacter sp. 2YAF2]|uniref:hypothetical protein n=1 Tax=Terrabacter sp. 2YAF2 TaxID=3233026 RepID=UPI003F9DB44B
MSLSHADRAALTQMFETEPDLDRWRLRAHKVEEPESASDLALDDKVFPHMAISQLARMSLVLSGEHLRLALDAVHAKQLYPSSHFTVLRGALVGASQGVWILSPEGRGERRERGLTVLTELYKELDKYYGSLSGLSSDEQEKLGNQQKWLSGRRAEVKALRTSKADLILTDVIRQSAEVTFSRAGHRAAVQRLWREMSADAHVLGWSLFQRSTFGPADRRTGIGEGQAPGSPSHVAEAFLASYRTLKHGWSLFDRRCEQPAGI